MSSLISNILSCHPELYYLRWHILRILNIKYCGNNERSTALMSVGISLLNIQSMIIINYLPQLCVASPNRPGRPRIGLSYFLALLYSDLQLSWIILFFWSNLHPLHSILPTRRSVVVERIWTLPIYRNPFIIRIHSIKLILITTLTSHYIVWNWIIELPVVRSIIHPLIIVTSQPSVAYSIQLINLYSDSITGYLAYKSTNTLTW